MLVGVAEFTSTLQEDSTELMKKVQALVVGVARDYMPAPLYIIRIDNWFGPKWMHFAGKFTAEKDFAIGVHKTTLHVPPFIPHRAVAERYNSGVVPELDARELTTRSSNAHWEFCFSLEGIALTTKR